MIKHIHSYPQTLQEENVVVFSVLVHCVLVYVVYCNI